MSKAIKDLGDVRGPRGFSGLTPQIVVDGDTLYADYDPGMLVQVSLQNNTSENVSLIMIATDITSTGTQLVRGGTYVSIVALATDLNVFAFESLDDVEKVEYINTTPRFGGSTSATLTWSGVNNTNISTESINIENGELGFMVYSNDPNKLYLTIELDFVPMVAFADYSEDDNSLNFYKRSEVPE